MVGDANDRSSDKMGCLVESSCSNHNIDSAADFVSGYGWLLFLAASIETVDFCVLLVSK